jgi:hypothetical protein
MPTTHETTAAIELAPTSERPANTTAAAPPAARAGRPLLVPPAEVLEHIRRLARRDRGLFRVDHTHPTLYARARRLYGTWAAAVAAAGLDYHRALEDARRRSIENRIRERRRERRRARGR